MKGGDRRGPWEEARTPDVQYKIAAFCRRVERTIRNSISPPLMYYNCTICTIHAHTACRSYTEQYRTNSKRSTATKSGSPNTQPHSLSIIKLYPQSASASHEIHENESGSVERPPVVQAPWKYREYDQSRRFLRLVVGTMVMVTDADKVSIQQGCHPQGSNPCAAALPEETVGHSPRDGLAICTQPSPRLDRNDKRGRRPRTGGCSCTLRIDVNPSLSAPRILARHNTISMLGFHRFDREGI